MAGEERYATMLIDLEDAFMVKGENKAERSGKGADMRDLGAALRRVFRGGGGRRWD